MSGSGRIQGNTGNSQFMVGASMLPNEFTRFVDTQIQQLEGALHSGHSRALQQAANTLKLAEKILANERKGDARTGDFVEKAMGLIHNAVKSSTITIDQANTMASHLKNLSGYSLHLAAWNSPHASSNR